MKPAPFDYSRPRRLDEAVELLARSNGSAKLLAGGQSLAPMLNLRLAPAERLIDLGAIGELKIADDRGATVVYGAMIRHAAFEDGLVPDASNGLMAYAAARIAFRAVRNRGTIGGALALADPAADWLPVAVALGAIIHVRGANGSRQVAAENFVRAPYLTDLDEGEILESIEIPRLSPQVRWGHSKAAIKVGEYAESLAVAVLDAKERNALVALGAANGPPILLKGLDAQLVRSQGDELSSMVRAELAASGRNFAPARLTMHATTVVRAIRDAMT